MPVNILITKVLFMHADKKFGIFKIMIYIVESLMITRALHWN